LPAFEGYLEAARGIANGDLSAFTTDQDVRAQSNRGDDQAHGGDGDA